GPFCASAESPLPFQLVPFKLTEIGPFSVLMRMLPLLPSMLIGPFCAVTSASPETLCKLIGPLFACAVSLPSTSYKEIGPFVVSGRHSFANRHGIIGIVPTHHLRAAVRVWMDFQDRSLRLGQAVFFGTHHRIAVVKTNAQVGAIIGRLLMAAGDVQRMTPMLVVIARGIMPRDRRSCR